MKTKEQNDAIRELLIGSKRQEIKVCKDRIERETKGLETTIKYYQEAIEEAKKETEQRLEEERAELKKLEESLNNIPDDSQYIIYYAVGRSAVYGTFDRFECKTLDSANELARALLKNCNGYDWIDIVAGYDTFEVTIDKISKKDVTGKGYMEE